MTGTMDTRAAGQADTDLQTPIPPPLPGTATHRRSRRSRGYLCLYPMNLAQTMSFRFTSYGEPANCCAV